MNRSIAALLAGAAMFAVPAVASAQARPAPATGPSVPAPVPPAQLARSVDIPYQQFTLPNGLRVVISPDHKAPVVAVSVWYNVGSKFEPAGHTGFAHLFEHLMFNGSENAPGDFFEPLKQVGATDFNGTTYFDRTNYFETVPTAALPRALFLESDRMGHLLGAVTQGVLDEQRGVVQNEKRQGDNQPYGLVQYHQIEALFPSSHPYGHTTIGSMADLDAASLTDVQDWFRGHYAPNNAVLVLAGDIDVATARPLVERYFGDLARGPASVAPPAAIPTLPARRDETIHDRVATTRLYRTWVVPGLNDVQSVSLDVAGGVLGGLSSSRLDEILVRRERLAVHVEASNESFSQLGMFEVSVDVRPGVDAAAVSRRLDDIIADFVRTGPTADEVQRYASTTLARSIQGLESVGGFGGKAVTLAEGALYSNDPGFYRTQLQRLAQQTPASVRAAMGRWLTRPVYALTVAPGPRDAYTEAGSAAHANAPTAGPSAATASPPRPGTRGPLPPVGQISDLQFPAVQRARLSNGIELVYAQRTAVPITQVAISFDAGVAADPADALGTQQLTLSLLDEGTTTRTGTQIAEQRERLGMTTRSGASQDRTQLGFVAPSANLAGATELFADIVRNPAFAPSEVERVRNQQLAQISAEVTNPVGLAQRALPTLVYGPAHPYARSFGSGDPAAVQRLTRDNLVAWDQAWLRPDKAKIFVVSDRPLAEVQAVLEARFGNWTASGTGGTKDFTVAATPASPRVLLIDRPDSPQSVIIAAIPTTLNGTDDLLPIVTANDSLGGNFLSRINMDLREGRHWSYGVSGNFQRNQYLSPYIIGAPVQADRTGDSIVALRGDVSGFLTSQPITQAEFDRTIVGGIRSLPGSFETSGAVLNAMQSNDLFRRPDNYYATLPTRYRALTLPQLNQVIRASLDPSKTVWIVVGDASHVRSQLDQVGLPVTVVPAASIATRAPAVMPTTRPQQ